MRFLYLSIFIVFVMTISGCWRLNSKKSEETSENEESLDGGVDTASDPINDTAAESALQDPRDPSCNKGDFAGNAQIKSSDDAKRYVGYTSVQDLEIHNNEANLSELHCLEHVKGDLEIIEYERETLEGLRNLRYVDGNARITHSDLFRHLTLPGLITIGGSLTISNHESLESVSMPGLEEIGLRIDTSAKEALYSILIHENYELIDVDLSGLLRAPLGIQIHDLFHAQKLNLSSLRETSLLSLVDIGLSTFDGFSALQQVGELQIIFCAIEQIDFLENLVQLGQLEVSASDELESISLPEHLEIGSLYVHDNFDLKLVEILSSAIFSFELEDNEKLKELHAGNLNSATKVRIEHNPRLETVDLSNFIEALASDNGESALVEVHNNASLTQLSLSSLVNVNGYFSITENEALPTLETGALQQVLWDLSVERNHSLTTLNLDSLTKVGAGFWVMDNAQLSCDMQVLLDHTVVGDDPIFCGNDESSSCGEPDC